MACSHFSGRRDRPNSHYFISLASSTKRAVRVETEPELKAGHQVTYCPVAAVNLEWCLLIQFSAESKVPPSTPLVLPPPTEDIIIGHTLLALPDHEIPLRPSIKELIHRA